MIKRKAIITLVSILLMSLTIGSCRDSTDSLTTYFDDLMNADTTYTGQFKAFWTFMDCNYPMWDYEATKGVDWDEVYQTYLPIFEQFDKKGGTVGVDELESVYKEIVTPLHDGHMEMRITHPYPSRKSDRSYTISPQAIRNQETRQNERIMIYQGLGYYKSWITNWKEDSYWHQFSDNIFYCRFALNAALNEQANWREWFEAIKEQCIEGTLKGVIIDLRGIRGGNTINFHYIIGALQPVNPTMGYHRLGWLRFKSGVGRYDYSPKTPQQYIADNDCQLNITDVPIVVLSDRWTGSLGEIICVAVQGMKKGSVVGKRTYGAFGPLISTSNTKYNCVLGDEQNETGSLYVLLPNATFFTDDGEILDGKGVTPDIEIDLDVDDYYATGRDTQLERALELIKMGK